MTVDNAKAETMHKELVALVEIYILQLAKAITENDIDVLQTIVEVGSPWHLLIQQSAQNQEWDIPHFEGGKFTYNSYLWSSLMALGRRLEKNQATVTQNDQDKNLYDFAVDGARITVSFAHGTMKLYDFVVPALTK